MQTGKFNVLMDLQWGSCGKGKFMPYLASLFGIQAVSGSNRPNAGHTVVWRGDDGEPKSAVFKVLPSAGILRTWGRSLQVFLSPQSAFDRFQLDAEIEFVGGAGGVFIHEYAQYVTQQERDEEARRTSGIASTMTGAGASLINKLWRDGGATLMDVGRAVSADLFHAQLTDIFRRGHTLLHECSQGWDLSLDWGQYPHVTSRNCGSAAALDQMGVSPRQLGDVYGIFRPYPIRVGNFEGHSSGPTHPGTRELTWDAVRAMAGAPYDLTETTTVTKRTRRVFSMSHEALQRACEHNGVSKLILNFAQHIDARAAGVTKFRELPTPVRSFIYGVENLTGIRVEYVGTGASHEEVCVQP